MRIRGLASVSAYVFAFSVGYAALAAAQGPGNGAPKEDAFFTGPPFTLDDILKRVGVIADKRLSTAIERRGISFSPTPDDYDKLKQAGAAGEIIDAIQAKAPPPPPPKPAPKPPPPPPPAGALTLTCAPADCEVVINGKSRGRTIEGRLDVNGLPPGPAVIDFRRDGFEGQQFTLTLRSGAPATSSATLKPTPALQAQVGKMLLNRVLERLGGTVAFQQASVVSASGNTSLWQAGGQRTDWQVSARLRLPAMALLEISGAKQKWWTSLDGADSKSDGTKKMEGGPVALEMEKLVRLYRDYQPALLIPRIAKMSVTAPAASPGPNGRWLLKAAGPDESYLLTLDKDATPVSVVYESASGLGSGLTVLYGDYNVILQTWYPKSMTIKYSDQAQHGLELHFTAIEFGGRLTDKDFHR
jgi:hypothetical protein